MNDPTHDTDPCPAPPPTRPSNPRPTPDQSELMARIEALASGLAAGVAQLVGLGQRLEGFERGLADSSRQLAELAPDLALVANELRRHGGELCILRTDVDGLPCRNRNGGVPRECPEAAE